MKRLWLSLIAASLLTIAAFAPAAAQDEVEIDLEELEDSGVSGTATLSADNGSTMVMLDLSGTPEDGDHPAHIHDGTCEDLGDVAYPLENVVEGTSESSVDVALEDILAGEYAINVHLSEDEIDTYVACGDVVAEEDEEATPEEDGEETPEEDGEATPEEDEEATPEEDAEETPEEDAEATPEEDEEATPEETPEEDAEETPEATPDDDEEAADDEDEDADELAPETGSDGGINTETAVLVITAMAGAVLGLGLLVRRRAFQS